VQTCALPIYLASLGAGGEVDVPILRGRHPRRRGLEPVPGLQRLDSLEHGAGGRDVAKRQEVAERYEVDPRLQRRVRDHCLYLGSEHQAGARVCVVEGFLTKSISHENELVLVPVPDGERERPAETIDTGRPDLLEEMHHDFGSLVAAKPVSTGLEPAPKPGVVEDLPVVHEDVAAVLTDERLPSRSCVAPSTSCP